VCVCVCVCVCDESCVVYTACVCFTSIAKAILHSLYFTPIQCCCEVDLGSSRTLEVQIWSVNRSNCAMICACFNLLLCPR
jgi:hypothetical protein